MVELSSCQVTDFEKEMNFLHLADRLKKEMRHCWNTDGRRESVAEHSWRLPLMVFRYADRLDQPVNISKCLKMALIHDLPEAIASDLPVIQQTTEKKAQQLAKEIEAIQQIRQLLNDKNGQEVLDLWLEYKSLSSSESRFVKALDKLEAFISHNESPLSTWEFREKQMLFLDHYLFDHCKYDSFLAEFAKRVVEDGIQKLKAAGEDINQIRDSALTL